MVQVHLSQETFSLATQLRSQQQEGEMTDTVLVCETGERVDAHCVVLSSHWVWAYLLRGVEWRGDKLNIIMDGYTRREVEELVSVAYANIEDGNYKLETERGEVKEMVKVEHELDIDLEELGYMDEEDEHVDTNSTVIDDSAVNIGEYFDLLNIVNQQILLNKSENTLVDSQSLKSRSIKDEIFKGCLKALEQTVKDIPSKVRGLPLHGFVFTDDAILEAAKEYVKQEKVKIKSDEGATKVTTYSCHFIGGCDYTSEEKHVVTRHVMESHTKQGAFMCKDCGKKFTVKDRAYRHVRSEHVDKKIKCLITENMSIDLSCKLCDKVYKRLDGLREHTKNVHEKQNDLKCPECDFISKDYLEVRRHRKDEHNFGHRACHVCGKQFSSQVGFDHHVENTHGNGSFPCENCGEIYKTKRALYDHRKRKHLEKTCVCDECGAKFHNQFSVKKHKKCHGTEYPFPCNLCDKKCRDKDQLKEHMFKHTGERPYRCKQCQATFNQSNALSRHTRVVHSGIRPFPCEHCSFRGGQAYDLVRHMKTVHPKYPSVVNEMDP